MQKPQEINIPPSAVGKLAVEGMVRLRDSADGHDVIIRVEKYE